MMKIETTVNGESVKVDVKFQVATYEDGKIRYEATAVLDEYERFNWLYRDIDTLNEEQQWKVLSLIPAIIKGVHNDYEKMKELSTPSDPYRLGMQLI
jgi:hypothetical protein